MKRLLVGVGAIVVGLLSVSQLAFAGGRQPTLSPVKSAFAIGANSPAGTTWTLNVWSQGGLVGTDSGTSGTLIVALPTRAVCKFQADVLRNGHWYSGQDGSFMSCGTGATTTTTTTTTAPKTSPKGGHKGGKHSTDPKLAATIINPPTQAAQGTATPVSGSRLAFTGVGVGLWLLALAGSGMVVLGVALVARRPRLRR